PRHLRDRWIASRILGRLRQRAGRWRLGLTAGRARSRRHLQIIIVGWSAAAHPALSSSVIRSERKSIPFSEAVWRLFQRRARPEVLSVCLYVAIDCWSAGSTNPFAIS